MKILFTLCALMGFAACSSNSSPGGNNNTLPGSVIDGGSYITLSDNLKTLSYIKGSVKHFDSSGNIYRIDEYDRDFGGMFGPQEVHAGLLGRPVFWLDSNSQEQSSKTFVGSTGDTGEVYGYNSHYKNSTQRATILPHNMTIGQTWEGCLAAEPIQCLLTLKQRMDHYTNSGGTTYSDVLQVYVTFFYSAGDTIRDYYGKKTTGTANLYFARGIGLVEGNLINYEHLNFNGYNGKLWSFVHEIATGTVWRKN